MVLLTEGIFRTTEMLCSIVRIPFTVDVARCSLPTFILLIKVCKHFLHTFYIKHFVKNYLTSDLQTLSIFE